MTYRNEQKYFCPFRFHPSIIFKHVWCLVWFIKSTDKGRQFPVCVAPKQLLILQFIIFWGSRFKDLYFLIIFATFSMLFVTLAFSWPFFHDFTTVTQHSPFTAIFLFHFNIYKLDLSHSTKNWNFSIYVEKGWFLCLVYRSCEEKGEEEEHTWQ